MPATTGPTLIAPTHRPTNKKIVTGRWTTASASDSVSTGLKSCDSVVVSLESDPADANITVSAVPNSDGTITIKTWKSADGVDVTPVAATSFTKIVNWIATGK